MKIEAEVDGKVLVYSSSLTMNPNGKLVFNFDNEARITVVFISEDTGDNGNRWICPYISRHLLSLNPLLACCRRYSRGER